MKPTVNDADETSLVQYIVHYLDNDPASMDRVNGDALLCGDRVGLQSRGVLTVDNNIPISDNSMIRESNLHLQTYYYNHEEGKCLIPHKYSAFVLQNRFFFVPRNYLFTMLLHD